LLLLLLVRNGDLGAKMVDGVTVEDGEWVPWTPLPVAVAVVAVHPLLAFLLLQLLLLLSRPELVSLPSALVPLPSALE